jgi:hypothetical protein
MRCSAALNSLSKERVLKTTVTSVVAIDPTAAHPESLKTARRGDRRWSLADEESRRRLADQGLLISAAQLERLHELSTWPIDIVGADTVGCIVNGRYDQLAIDRYFEILDHVAALGRGASLSAIVRCIAGELAGGMASVLLLAVRCGMFSDAVAHEAHRRLLEQPEWLRDPNATEAVEWYRLVMDTTRETIDKANK